MRAFSSRDGLRHLRLTRDVIAHTYRATPDAIELARKTRDLQTLRGGLDPRHVVLGDVATGVIKRGIKPFGSGGGDKAD